MIEINLTNMEYKVLLLLITGATNKQIAEKLNRGKRTIDSHIANILSKTNSHNRGEVIAKYFDNSSKFVNCLNIENFKYVKIINLYLTDNLKIQQIAHRVNTSYNYANSIITKYKKGLIKI